MDIQSFHYARGLCVTGSMPAPYGGLLVQSVLSIAERTELAGRVKGLSRIVLSTAELFALELIASGAFSPLTGFMNQAVYRSVLASTALPDGRPWGLPVTLAVSRDAALAIRSGQEAALYHGDQLVGVMLVEDMYAWDAEAEAQALGKAQDAATLAERRARDACYLVGGPVALLATRETGFMQHGHRWPLEMRHHIGQRGWQRVAVPHVKLPWLRSHEYLLRCALETSDGLLLHAPIGSLSGQDSVLAAASRQLVENYFPVDRVLEGPLPAGLLVAHPRAWLTHAILSQNYGATSLLIPDMPETRETQELFNAAARHGLSLHTVTVPEPFHCEACGGMASAKTCPHDERSQLRQTEEEVLAQLQRGEPLSPLQARPDIARSLARGFASQPCAAPRPGARHIHPHAPEVSRELREAIIGHKACALWMTGLSGSGKSTIAHRLERELLLAGQRVFVLDGDTLRQGLNRDLGFNEADRRENLRRAAELVKVLLDAGMIVIASFISPFRAERAAVREILGSRFHEVYVEAALETCEQRDPKGLYRRARNGEIAHFTGISSPYEAPEAPDLRLNTSTHTLEDCVQQTHDYLAHVAGLRASRVRVLRGDAVIRQPRNSLQS